MQTAVRPRLSARMGRQYEIVYHLPDRLNGLSLVDFPRWLASGSIAEGSFSRRLPFDGELGAPANRRAFLTIPSGAGSRVANMTDALDLLKLASGGLSELAAVARVDDGIVATTHCMYPSNGLVKVTVRGSGETIVASDDGGALGEAFAAGIDVKNYDRTLGHLVKEQGLLIRDGVIYTPQMAMMAAPLAILLVANASQEVARWMFDHGRTFNPRDVSV